MRNHLPLDLVLRVSDNSPAGQAGLTKALELLTAPGIGHTAPPSTPELLINAPDSLPPEPISVSTDGGVSSPEPILTPESDPLEPLLIPGNGQAAILHSLSAETWYNLRFKTRSVIGYDHYNS